MTRKLEEARGDQNKYKQQLNMAAKRTTVGQMLLTLAEANTEKAKRRITEVKRLAHAKMVDAQRIVDKLRVLKYLEGYKDGTENAEKKHSTAELDVSMPIVDAAEEGDIDDSSAEESEDADSEDVVDVAGIETIISDQAHPSTKTSIPRSSLPIAEDATTDEASADKRAMTGKALLPDEAAAPEKASSSIAASPAKGVIPPAT
jgi:hypothetical protein